MKEDRLGNYICFDDDEAIVYFFFYSFHGKFDAQKRLVHL